MANFSQYGDMFSSRYGKAIDAADKMREMERGSEESFANQVDADINAEPGAPDQPMASQEDEQFDPGVDESVEDLKNSLLKKSKDRMAEVVGTDD